MIVFACEKCKYTDLYEEYETAFCPRCGGRMLSLGVNSAVWNNLNTEEIYELIYEKTGSEDTVVSENVNVHEDEDSYAHEIHDKYKSIKEDPEAVYSCKPYTHVRPEPRNKRIAPGLTVAVITSLCISFIFFIKYHEKSKTTEHLPDKGVLELSTTQNLEEPSGSVENYPTYEFTNCLYYDSMGEKEKEIYQIFYDLVMHKDDADYERQIRMPLFELEKIEDDIDLVFYAMLRDHPEFFYINASESRLPSVEGYTDNVAAVVKFKLGPADLKENEMIAKFDSAVSNFMRGIDKNASDADIELQIHDKLNDMVSYDKALIEIGLDRPDLAHTAYGALVDNGRGSRHKAVCDGYAQAYQYLLGKAGICAAQVTGDADTPGGTVWGDAYHAWNIVKLDEEWYEVDCCWDDLELEELQDFYLKKEIKKVEDKYFYVTHHWFNRTTEEMKHLPASERTRFFVPGYESFNFIEETSHVRKIDPNEEWYRSYEYLNKYLPIASGTKYAL